ncbi:uncharacterized protein LOC101852993 [Aplysia californica]|uniref:Uncharacterized protein LOC101852993 n=1 Tax=Aplysia californica TaxID=6500 RepID=A0ABM0JKG6_APLCA|nr:uncharacterized protein LOC101852993 [Aplysia californica]XP_005095826.1 uncharacterized protein LOC101852993 [Aplysia californica]XP_005095827.1 uncharacterized protein LOC101852993 [Aplysia californica]
MSNLRGVVGLSGYPNAVDVTLHPDPRSIAPPGFMFVSIFEVESLYKLYCKLNSDNNFFKEENERLGEEIRFHKTEKAELILRINDMKKSSSLLESNILDLEQKIAHLQCQVNKLENDRDVEMLNAAGVACQNEEIDDPPSLQEFHGNATGDGDLRNVMAEIETKTADANRAFLEASSKADTLLRSCNDVKRVFNSLVAENNGPSEREKELLDKLKKIEAMNDILLEGKKVLEKENKQLSLKLKTLTTMDEEEDIREFGRFKIKSRSVECAVCHETFSSVMEMEQSACHFHKSSSVPAVLDTGIGKFWPCCEQFAKSNKTAQGCRTGKHRQSTKRFRRED